MSSWIADVGVLKLEMNLIRSLILVAFGGTLLLLALRRLRSYKLKERYALLFLFLGLPFLVLAVWGNGIVWLAHLLHMEYFTVMLLCVSTFLILTVFELLTIVSQQDSKISTLAQMVGILVEKQKQLDQAQVASPLVKTAELPAPLEQAMQPSIKAEPILVEKPSVLPGRSERGVPTRAEVTLNPVSPRRPRTPVRSSD